MPIDLWNEVYTFTLVTDKKKLELLRYVGTLLNAPKTYVEGQAGYMWFMEAVTAGYATVTEDHSDIYVPRRHFTVTDAGRDWYKDIYLTELAFRRLVLVGQLDEHDRLTESVKNNTIFSPTEQEKGK